MRWSVENWVKRLNSLSFLRISAEKFWNAILGKSLWISLTDENARSRLADRGTRSKIFSTTSSKVLSTLRKIISVFPKIEVHKIRWTILPRFVPTILYSSECGTYQRQAQFHPQKHHFVFDRVLFNKKKAKPLSTSAVWHTAASLIVHLTLLCFPVNSCTISWKGVLRKVHFSVDDVEPHF